MVTHEGTPASKQIPAEWQKEILHAMKVGNDTLMASDAPPGRFNQPQGFSVSLQIEEPRKPNVNSMRWPEGGVVHMPIGQTF